MLTLVGAIVLMAGLVGLFWWTPWDAEVREREHDWLAGLSQWTLDYYERQEPCERRLERDVRDPPTERLEAVLVAARRSCRPGQWGSVDWRIQGSLISTHRGRATTTPEPDLSRIAGSIAGRKARARCWSADDWARLSEQYAALVYDELWLAGLADPLSGRIDLSPVVCDELRRFLHDRQVPSLVSTQAYTLSEALVVLAHEAEHLRTPAAEEDVVECHALQRVRGLVREAGWGREYQSELALLAWDLGYPNQLDDYRTELCHDAGPLDLDPESRTWP
jgi:hypothetical protein